MGLSASDTLRIWSTEDAPVCLKNIEFLADHFDLETSEILMGTYSVSKVRSLIFGTNMDMPEVYLLEAYSRVRSSAHIIEYLVCRYGRRFADRILSTLNVNPVYFEKLDNEISLRFFVDLLDELKKLGMCDDELALLPSFLTLTLSETELGRKFSFAKTHRESINVLADNIHRFDLNFSYHFEMVPGGADVMVTPREHILQGMEDHFLEKSGKSLSNILNYRKGFSGLFTLLSDLEPLIVEYKDDSRSSFDRRWIYKIRYPQNQEGQPAFLISVPN